MSRYIDADKLLETLNKNKIPYNGEINYFITHAPTVDVQKIRQCRNITEMHHADEFICSECEVCFKDMSEYDSDEDVYKEFYFKFCPNCGAKMEKE